MSKATASVKDRFESYFNAKHAKRSPEQIESILKDALVSLEFVLRNSDRVRVKIYEEPDPFEVEVEHDDLIDFSYLADAPKPPKDFYEGRPIPLEKCPHTEQVIEWGVQVFGPVYPIKGDFFKCRVAAKNGNTWAALYIAIDDYGTGRKF